MMYDKNNPADVQRLTLLKRDCDFYLGKGKRDKQFLFRKNVHSHISKMYDVYENFPENGKPDEVTLKDIDLYAVEMFLVDSAIDKYYVDDDRECVTQVYYNPESNAGGQFVLNEFDFDLIKEAFENGDDGALEFLKSECRQFCVDAGDYSFRDEIERYISHKENFSNYGYDVIAELKKTVNI